MHTLVTLVKLVDLSSWVMKMAWAEPLHFPTCKLPWMANRPTTDEEDLHLKARSKTVILSVFTCKLKDLANIRGSSPPVTLHNTLVQVHSMFVR